MAKHAFLLGAAANWLAFAATLAVGFLLTPHLIRGLGLPRYDVWCVVESVLAYLTLLDFGVAVSLVRHAARHRARADVAGLNRVASNCLAVFLAAGALALLLGGGAILILAPRLQARLDGPSEVAPFMLVMLANLAATLPLSVFSSVLDGLERFALKSAVRVGFLAARTAGLVAVIATGGGLLNLGLVVALTSIAEQLTLAACCYRVLPGFGLSWRDVDRVTLREVRGSSVDAFLAMLAGRITVQTGAILAGLFFAPGAVTFYATAARLVEYAKTLLRTVTTTLTPGVSAMEAAGDWPGIAKLFRGATRWMLYLVLPVNLGLWLAGPAFLARWVGPEFVAVSFPCVAILALTLSLGVAQSVASRVLYGLGRLRGFARAALAEAALNLTLTLVLVSPRGFDLGLPGVALGVAVPNLIVAAIVIGLTLRALNVTLRDYLREWVTPLLLAAGLAAVWLTLGDPPPTWPGLLVWGLAGLAPYALAAAALESGRPRWLRGRRRAFGVAGAVLRNPERK